MRRSARSRRRNRRCAGSPIRRASGRPDRRCCVLTSLASVCLPLRTISMARLTAATSIAAAVMMVVAGGGIALRLAVRGRPRPSWLPRLEAFLLGGDGFKPQRPAARAAAAGALRRAAPAALAGSASCRPAVCGLGSGFGLAVVLAVALAVGLGFAACSALACVVGLRLGLRFGVWLRRRAAWQRPAWLRLRRCRLVGARLRRDARGDRKSPRGGRPASGRASRPGRDASRPIGANGFLPCRSNRRFPPPIAIALIGLRKAKIPRKRGHSWAHPNNLSPR